MSHAAQHVLEGKILHLQNILLGKSREQTFCLVFHTLSRINRQVHVQLRITTPGKKFEDAKRLDCQTFLALLPKPAS